LATQGLDGLRQQLDHGGSRVAELAAREETFREEEENIGRRLQELEAELQTIELQLEALEDGVEDLRTESLRTDRVLLRLESGSGRGEKQHDVSRLESELRRLSQALRSLEDRSGELEAEHAQRREESLRLQRRLKLGLEHAETAQTERARLAGELESLRARLARSGPTRREGYFASESDLARGREARGLA
jgi:DNA repair exonuclease SbcCD ATPase subunit